MKEFAELLEELIKRNSKNLTNTERKIANFFLEKYSEIPFLSIHDLADKLGVGRASIMRFTNKLGFDGYLALKKEMKDKLQTTLAPLERFRSVLDDDKSGNTLIVEIADNEVNNINAVLKSFNPGSLKKAVDLITKSNIVFTVGCDLSSYIAGITSYLLQRIGIKSVASNVGGRSLVDQLFIVQKKDVVIAFSLPPYSQDTIDAAKYAKEHGAKVIAFTDTMTAPLVPYSEVVLQIKSDSTIFANSLASIIVLIYTFVCEVALKNKSRSKYAIDDLISRRE